MSELKSCPFCGSQPYFKSDVQIHCDECNLIMSGVQGREELARVWNTRAVPEVETSEWIPWNGGKCPIPDAKGGEYRLRLRDGRMLNPRCNWAIDYNWVHSGFYADIVAYRLLEKEQSVLDWLEAKIKKDIDYWKSNHNSKDEVVNGIIIGHQDILNIIKVRKG